MTSLLSDVRHGSQAPRVCNYPPAHSSAGQDAIDLAETAGLVLDPWQQDVLRASLGELPGGRWAAGEVGLIVPRQNGKGAVLEARELAGLFLFGESILHTSHEFKTSMDHYRRLERLIRNTPDLHRKVEAYPRAPGTEGIVMRDGRALRFMARTKGSGRGFPADVVILDEAFALTDEQLSALLPTMSARPNPQTWYTSSPPLDGLTGAPLFALRVRGEAGGEGLAWFDWGADPDTKIDPDAPDIWRTTNPAMGYRISEESVARERRAMSAEDFCRERLGVWPRNTGDEWSVISKADWEDAADPVSQARDPVVFAINTSWQRTHTAIAAVGEREDGNLHGVIVEHRPHGDWVVPRLVELACKWRPAAIVLDPSGATNTLLEPLNRALVEADAKDAAGDPLQVTTLTARQAAAGWGMVYDALSSKPRQEREGELLPEGKRLFWRSDLHAEALTTSVRCGTRRRLAESFAWECKTAAVDMSPIKAVTDGVYGFVTRPVSAAPPFFARWGA